MSRHHDHDDREPDLESQPRGIPPSILVFGLLVLLLIVAAVGGGVWFMLSARQQAREAVAMRQEMLAREQAALQAKMASQQRAPISRDDFKSMVLGKTPAEVIKAVGKPDETSDVDDSTWLYRERTLDPVTRKPDARIRLSFEKGVVKAVRFD
jgi:hypothetical protein